MTFSSGQTHKPVVVLLSVLALGIYGYLLITFVSHDLVSSFATDSANYLVMARYLSPWHETTTAIAAAWPQQDFPVLFPLFLAVSGSAYDFYIAHAITAALLVVSLPLIYCLARAVTLNRVPSLFVTLLFAISPAVWVNTLGILSENLYILLSVCTLLFYQRLDRHNRLLLCIFGILLAAMVLTRTIGVSLLAGYCLLITFEYWRTREKFGQALIPVIVAVGLVVLAESFHSTTVPDQYIDQMLGLVENDNANMELEFDLLKQFGALIDAWFVSWMYYWNSNLVASYVAFAGIGLLGLAGLAWRSVKLELDAIYLVIYLLILLLWPHPGQTARFIYPVMFLLLINAFIAARYLLTRLADKPRQYLSVFAILLSLISLIPAQIYTYHRHQAGSEIGCQYFREFYLRPDLTEARKNCAVQTVMQKDLTEIGQKTAPDTRVMYFVSAYVALLADRVGINIEFYRDATGRIVLREDEAVDYVYLSELHPRKTRETINGLAVMPYFDGWTSIVKTGYSTETGRPVSVLLQPVR